MGISSAADQRAAARAVRALPRVAVLAAALVVAVLATQPWSWVATLVVVLLLVWTGAGWWRYVMRGRSADVPAPPSEFTEPGGYRVVLTDTGARRIEVIRALREISDLDLVPAKSMTNRIPVTIVSNVSHTSAERVAQRLERAGGQVLIGQVEE